MPNGDEAPDPWELGTLLQLLEKPFIVDRLDDARIHHRRGGEIQHLGAGAAHVGENRFHSLQCRIGHVGKRAFQISVRAVESRCVGLGVFLENRYGLHSICLEAWCARKAEVWRRWMYDWCASRFFQQTTHHGAARTRFEIGKVSVPA